MILGAYCFEISNNQIMKSLLKSKHHWSRRIAIVSTLYWIRNKKTSITFQFSKILLKDTEDLMHKSTGWMLREAGKRKKPDLEKFIQKYGHRMPRTMLRYAIEHFSKKERDLILKTTRLQKK
jgi:3-methyladenine DNA glycosylase AlkD